MIDYNPRPPPIGPQSGKGGIYLVLGVLIALVLASGLLFFNTGTGPSGRNDQASQPTNPADKTLNVPATPSTEPRMPRVPPAAPARPEQPAKE